MLAAPWCIGAQTLAIGDGAVVTIGVGASVSYGTAASSGTVTSDANTKLVIESTSSGSGSLICGGTPNATVNRYITDNEWHLVTPITSPSNASDFYLGDVNRSWFAKHNESTDTWTYIITVDTAITRPTGFSYWVEDGQGPQAIDFTGTLIGTDVTATLVKANNGWNLIGNPFPCAIDWDGVAAGNTNGTCYVWDNSQSGYLYSTGGSGPTGAGAVGTLPDNIIPMGQGFFVQASSADDFTIPSGNRVHSSNAFLKSGSNVTNDNIDFIRIDLDGGYYGNTVFVGFPENGTDEFDINGDATKLFSSADQVQFFAVENDIELCINSNTPLEEGESKIVPLNLVQVSNDSHTMSFTAMENFDEDISIILEDTKLNYEHNVRELPTYTFTSFENDDPDRFLLHFASSPNGSDNSELINDDSHVKIYSFGKNIRIVSNNDSSNDILNIRIYDIYGRKVTSEQTVGKTTIIPMDFYNSTYFIVEVLYKSSVYTEKVFIK